MSEKDFDAIYGSGMWMKIALIINDLAPVTRRDDWWSTVGPYEAVARHLTEPQKQAA